MTWQLRLRTGPVYSQTRGGMNVGVGTLASLATTSGSLLDTLSNQDPVTETKDYRL